MARFASVFFFATLALVGAGCQLLGQDADAPDPVAAAIERSAPMMRCSSVGKT